MTHLRIELSNGVTELVDSTVIKKLYDLAVSELDSTSNLKGRLHALKAYGSHITYLTQKYPELYITVENRYVDFADPEVLRVLLTSFGDGTGILESQISNITDISNMFDRNTTIQTFDELSLTGVDTLYSCAFRGCTNLRSIDTSKIKYLKGGYIFEDSNLDVIDLSGLDSYIENGVTKYGFVAPSSSLLGIFKNCTSKKIVLGKCDSLGNLWASYDLNRPHFTGCSNLETVDVNFLNKIETNGLTFRNCPNMKNFIIRSTTVPQATLSPGTVEMNDFGGANVKIYVPDSAVETYKTATGWTGVASNIYPLSEYVES